MADMNDIVRLAVDAYHGKTEKFSVEDSMSTLRQAMIEANGGNTVLNYKAIRDGKCNGLFALVEEILSRTTVEGFPNDPFFNALVDYRNVKAGDKNQFVVADNDLFVIADVADGTQGVRRQRLGGATTASIDTSYKGVKIYEEMNRVLSGQIDFNEMIRRVSESFRQKMLNDIYALWSNATATDLGGAKYFPTAGSYSESGLLDVIEDVEAAAGGKRATIIGTKKAIRNLAMTNMSNEQKSDLFNLGYSGKFFGTPVVAVPQMHKVNSTDRVFADDTFTIIAGDDKPIKFVYDGDATIIPGDPTKNADLTNEYLYLEKYGMGIVLSGSNGGVGKYQIA